MITAESNTENFLPQNSVFAAAFPSISIAGDANFRQNGITALAEAANRHVCTENQGLSPPRRLKLSLANFHQTKHSSRVRAILRAWEDL
ncbi:hypothetical protein H6M51_15535 [Rhizobium sp. AQ_MP]|uniref:hypothetical protein n=1 Tax=Rhizobium sp. AQ_MP TaxID=2761536 RepID=UPI00163B54D8|nr:hypothetical protein [Rhizobium sp. AQ_MP]MBC2774276.1 hypothetical protein [Rhizobium sp. AQ_MP]